MREKIMAEGRKVAQAHGYGGLNFRDLAQAVGIKSASLHYHFPTKADLGAALAERYCQDAKTELDGISAETADLPAQLRRYTDIFRRALDADNRMCMCSYMVAETDDLPEAVHRQVAAFAQINMEWLRNVLAGETDAAARAQAIFAAVTGAQLAARGRGDRAVYDEIIATYGRTGLIPA